MGTQDDDLDDDQQQQQQHDEDARNAEGQSGADGGGGPGDDDDDDDDGDATGRHAAEGSDDDELESLRERRRQERKRRKEAARNREAGYRREIAQRDATIDELTQRIEALEHGSRGARMAALDNAIAQAGGAYESWKAAHAEAVKANNGEAATQALENMQAARDRFNQLSNIKQAANSQRGNGGTPAPQMDPRVVRAAQNWMKGKDWYDPAGGNTDSRIVLTVDQELSREGWVPTTVEYWQELDSRLRRYLPHRYTKGARTDDGDGGDGGDDGDGDGGQQGQQQQQQRQQNGRRIGGPAGGGGGDGGGGGGGKNYRLSPERVRAMKEAGIWDDPVKRDKMIKQYREFDRNNGIRS